MAAAPIGPAGRPYPAPTESTMTFWEIVGSIFWFMLLFAWIWLLITILADIFRDREMSGWAKALWVLFIIVLPWLGALIYLIARGGSMHERAVSQAQRNEEDFRRYVQQTAGAGSTADELGKLADLRDRGAISAEDYEKAKAKVLGHDAAPAADSGTDSKTAATP